MTTQVVVVNTATVLGIGNLTEVQAIFATSPDGPIIPLPLERLFALGVRVISDVVTTPAGQAVRTTTLGLTPAVAPTATAARNTSAQAGPITGLTITNRGDSLTAPPIVTIGDTHVLPDGSISVPSHVAQANATLRVKSVALYPGNTGGSGYTGATTATAVGGLLPGGVPATFTVTIMAGAVSSINLVTAGGPYFEPPTIILADVAMGGGTGALADVPNMELLALNLTDPGEGYVTPSVTLTGLYKFTYPDSAGTAAQAQPFFNLLREALQNKCPSPVIETAPVVT